MREPTGDLVVPPAVPRRGNAVTEWIGRTILSLAGWRAVGELPDSPKMIILVAPHSSNWDFVLGMALVFKYRLEAHWLGKSELFARPLGAFMRWLGGVSIDRSAPHGVVDQTVMEFANRKEFVLAITPEGTRKRVTQWKTGFYRIADGGKIPVTLGFLNYAKKTVGFGPTIWVTGDMEKEVAEMKNFYAAFPRKNE